MEVRLSTKLRNFGTEEVSWRGGAVPNVSQAPKSKDGWGTGLGPVVRYEVRIAGEATILSLLFQSHSTLMSALQVTSSIFNNCLTFRTCSTSVHTSSESKSWVALRAQTAAMCSAECCHYYYLLGSTMPISQHINIVLVIFDVIDAS